MGKSKITSSLMLMVVSLLVVMSVFSLIDVPTVTTVYAVDSLEDDIGSEVDSFESSDTEEVLGSIRDQEIVEGDQDVAEWFKGQGGMSSEQLEVASRTVSPITSLIGYITGAIVVLIIIGVGAITALDLLYISIPPVRNFLYKAGTSGTGGYTGGFGAGGAAGGAVGGTSKPTQWVSDEAVACAALLGGSAQSNNMMGGMAGMQQQQQPTTRSVIGTYFRKRLFFILLLGICVIVLTSSTVMDCGFNLAEWVLKLISVLNGKLEG